MNKLSIWGKLIVLLGAPLAAYSCCALVMCLYYIIRTLAIIVKDWRKARAKRREVAFELDSDEVDKAAREYFCKPYDK